VWQEKSGREERETREGRVLNTVSRSFSDRQWLGLKQFNAFLSANHGGGAEGGRRERGAKSTQQPPFD
jgi:hypothetical protein